MNPAPLSRREHVAISILQSLIVHPVAPGIPDHQIIESAVRNADALLAELDRTAPREAGPVSPLLPVVPDNVLYPPDGYAYYGDRPLTFPSDGRSRDVIAFDPDWESKTWDTLGWNGTGTNLHYALRRGTPIARANGIPDQA